MSEWVLAHERAFRLAIFIVVFGGMALWEVVSPRRPLTFRRARRWPTNLLVAALDSFVVRLVSPSAVVGMAWLAHDRRLGLFNLVELPAPIAVPASILALDFIVYLQHVLMHRVPALWRLHLVHHADLDVDVTTGSRFHPLEILLSFLLKSVTVVLLGAPSSAVLVFEVLLNSSSLFNHSNVHMSHGIDRLLRSFLVTPDMHRVHHSIVSRETNSNFGFCMPWWDRLLGTYRAQPEAGHESMVIGLPQFRDDRPTRLGWVLAAPYRAGARQ